MAHSNPSDAAIQELWIEAAAPGARIAASHFCEKLCVTMGWLLSEEYKMPDKPKASDVLFEQSGDWMQTASLNSYGCRWELYATGYKEAADVLVERVLETNRGMDFLVYPIVFLYRHYLELRLKEIILTGRELVGDEAKVEHVHRLNLLWKPARKILEEVWPNEPRDELEAVEECIRQFCETDPDSMSFRYPVTKNSKPTIPSGLTHVNVRNLSQVMERVSGFLEGCSCGISAYLDDQRSCRD